MVITSQSVIANAISSQARGLLRNGSSLTRVNSQHFSPPDVDLVAISEQARLKSIVPLVNSDSIKPRGVLLVQNPSANSTAGTDAEDLNSAELSKIPTGEDSAALQQSEIFAQRFSELELRTIQSLAARDTEVRLHERAHTSAGGKYARAPSYTFTRGPDGKNYVTGGEVSISISPVADDPGATLQKAEAVRRAALAPAQPSTQDRAVASRATQMATLARAEINLASLEAQQTKEPEEESENEQGADQSSEQGSQQRNQVPTETDSFITFPGGRDLSQEGSIKQLQKNPLIAEFTPGTPSGVLINLTA